MTPPVKGDGMRGLSVFISDIRNCKLPKIKDNSPKKGDSTLSRTQTFHTIYSLIKTGKSREAEVKRINKELANIRSKFKGDKTLDGYQKKKYVCKLLFIFLLGHDIDFGQKEAVNLLVSNKYTEKQIVIQCSVYFLSQIELAHFKNAVLFFSYFFYGKLFPEKNRLKKSPL